MRRTILSVALLIGFLATVLALVASHDRRLSELGVNWEVLPGTSRPLMLLGLVAGKARIRGMLPIWNLARPLPDAGRRLS